MSNTSKESLRSFIRKTLQENYPAGAEHHPDAPWNQEEPRINYGKSVGTNLEIVGGDENSELIVTDGDKYYIVVMIMSDQQKQDMIDTYGDVPYDIGDSPEDDASPDYENAEFTTDHILSAAQDAIDQGQVDTVQDYVNGDGFVYELTSELAEELTLLHNEPIVKAFL